MESDAVFDAVVVIAVLVIVTGIFLLWGISIVGYDEYAVEKEFGTLKTGLKETGFNWVGFGSLIRVNNQVRNYEVVVEAASRDYQDVTLTVNLNIVILKDKVFDFIKNYPSEEVYSQYLNNKVQERIKTVVIKYDAESILNNRLSLSKELYDSIKSMPELSFFEFNDLAIKNIQFSDKFSETLERKAQVNIEKEILTKQKDNLELLKSNMQIVSMSDYFKYQLIEKWDGKSNLVISDAIIR